jgi:hypothetical protein
VEVWNDGGAAGGPAELGPPQGDRGWGRWTFGWDAVPGEHELCVRAADDSGATQPLQPAWNAQGMANNGVQRVPVHVR